MQETHGQLGFCSGNSGDLFFTEDFGTGIVNGPQLSPLTTTYEYTSTYPNDGEYTVSNGTFGNVFDWHEIEDHTSNDVCSFESIIYNVISPEAPIIESVVSNGIDIIITTANSGDFLYSLDGIIFQSNNIFYDVEGGLYTIYLKNRDCDTTINIQHLHFFIPKFFTPNNDGINDTFNLSGIENYGGTQVAIFDRYGKLLKFSRNVSFEWDGTYNSQNMP